MSRASGRSSDELLQMICHELRGALHPIATWARLLQSPDLKPGDTDEAGAVIQRSVRLAARLCDDLLSLGGAEPEPWAVALAPLDLRETVRGALEAADRDAGLKGLHLAAHLPAEPVQVLGDGLRLGQVVSNVLDNALKFTDPPGIVTVDLATGDGCARLTVADTGRGIHADLLPRVFDKFTRGAAGDGRGLGLYVVDRLVRLHGGTVEADSPGPGRGSRFVVTLPVTIAVAA